LDLKGKVVLITGAREGIGAACAREFLRRGARLSLVDISREPIDYDDEGSLWTYGDITDPDVRRRAVDTTIARLGRIDVLVNNAGIGLYSSPSETAPEHAERMFAVNVSAPVGLTGLVAPHMRRRGDGAIVNIESIGSLVSLPWCAMYCASKHALHAYTRSLYHELKPAGIHVMSVMPGIVDTRFREHVLGGDCPPGVSDIRRVISPASLARSVVNGLEKGQARVMYPKIGWAFWAMEILAPWAMHWYVRSRWTPPLTDREAAAHSLEESVQ